jgi:simple sugar transport system substrate-binding protein
MSKNLMRGLALALCIFQSPLTLAQAAPLKVGFVYVSPIGQAGWTYQHDQGRQAMERALGSAVSTRFVEAVPEGADAERVMRDLATQGHQLIFATSRTRCTTWNCR